MDPIDYSGAFANIQPPAQAFTQGLQGGVALQQVQAEQTQQQAALARRQQMQADLATLSADPTPQAIAQASLKYPELSEQFKRSLDMLTPAQQQAKIDAAGPVHAAVLAGEYGIAAKQLRQHADAAQNSGNDQEAQQTRAMADLIEQHPETAKLTTGMLLASAMGPERYTKAFGDIGSEQRAADLAPAAVRAANAKATGDESDVTLKNLGIVAQKAGALAKPGVKPSQAETMFRTLAAQGLIPKADLQGYIDGIPTDPKALPDYLKQVQAAGMTSKEQMGFTTPDANTVANNTTSRYTADSTARTAAARLQFDKDQAKDEPVAPVGTPGLQGQKYLDSLDKPTADQVKALAEGRLGFPVGKALQSPYWQKMITAVAQYDPSFDAVNYNARAKTRNDMVAGKSAENIKAINTAIAHMGQLNDQLSGLHNTNSPAYNTVANWLGTHLGNEKLQTKLSAADATAEGVAGEMAKVFRSTGMSEHEIDAWRKKFGNSTTPGQQKGTMQSAMHMLQGRMEAIQEQYKVGMGTTAQPLQILTPEAQVIFDKLIGSKPHAKAAPAAATSSGPAAGAVEGGYRFKGGDPSQPTNWEKL